MTLQKILFTALLFISGLIALRYFIGDSVAIQQLALLLGCGMLLASNYVQTKH